MALSLDDYKRIASDTHPDWNDAQKEQWAQSKVSGAQSDSNQQEEEGRWGLLSGLADWGKKAGTSISGWFDDLISDETAENSTIGKLGDMALNVVGGVLGGAVQSIAETPNFVGNLVSMPFTDKSEWGWSDVKDRARELQDDYGMNRAGAWLTAIDENNNSEHVGAQTIFQLLNNPLLGKGIGKGLDIVGGAIKGTGKTAQVVGKVSNVADDAAKISKGAKVAGAAEEVIEDTTKTAGKTNILSKIKNGYDKTKNYLKETTIGTKLKDAGVNTARFVGGPITDVYDILKVGVKTTRTAMKSSGVGSSLMEGLRATLGETVQTAGKFISKPLSYRTPRLWTTSTADMLLGDNIERGMAAGDKGDFRDEYGYSIDLVGYLNDDELQQYYDQNNIPQNKRLTADQIKEKQSQMGQNMFSDFTEGAKNLYEMFDIFSAPSFIMEQRRNNPGEVEVERNVRGEFRGFSNGKSINFSTGEVKDADGNSINLEDLTADELKEVGLLYEQKQAEEMGEGTPYTWSQQTGIKSNNITDTINNWAINGMLSSDSENLVMSSDNAGVRANAIYINNQINEASKEYVNSIIANYTVDEINSNPQLQREIQASLDSYSKLFNTTAEIIAGLNDDDYNDVYRAQKAMRAAYNSLDDEDKNNIDNNLYRKSIDYNNNLESGFDKFWMKSATWVKRSTDKMLNMFWSGDTNEWFEQGLSGLAGSLINPELASWGTAWGEISSGLRSNAAYAVDMVVLNKINDAVVEKFTGNMFDKAIRSNPKLYTKGFNGIKGGVTEMSSEFLENFTDAISMVEDPNTDYDFVTGFLFGMFQGAMAGYASSTDSYTSFKDYLTRPENRNAVLENMGIYVDAIEDPQQKAVMLSIVSQLMDDKSENNLIDIIVNTASQTNNGVENLMQAYALYQVNKMVGDYTNNLVGQVLDEVNSVDEWTPELIQQYFGTDADPTGRKNFNNYNTGRQFVFSSAVINDIKNREENKRQAETIAKTSAAFIKSSFKTAGMSFEEGLNFMAPKINASNGKKVITPIKKTRTVERDIVDQTTGNPIKDTVSVFVKTGEIAFTIGDKLGITSKNDKLFGEKKSRFGLKTTKGFKNKIEVKTTNEDGTEKTETLTMKDYLVKQLNEANLTDEERQFIGTVLFKTTVSGLNPYFKDDGSLTKLGEDFLKQVMPQLEERTSTVDFFVNLASIQTLKEAQVEKSKNDAMKESGANEDPIPTLNIGGQAVEAGTNVSNLSDDTELLIEKDGKKATIKDLKNGGITVSDNGRLCTMRIKEDGTLDIIYDEEIDNENVGSPSYIAEQEQPFGEEQQQTTPIQQEDGTILFSEDQRLDALSEEEFQKEYDQAEKDRKEAWRKYFRLKEEIDNSPSTSDTARDQRFDTLVRLEREAYKATNKKKRMEESKARREKNGVPTAVEETVPTEEEKKLDQQIEEAIEDINIDDIDDETPPPAAPAVQQEAVEEQPNEAMQQVQERLNQVWTALPGATGEKVVQNTNPDTMETTVPVSVYEHDHQDLQGKFVDVKTLLGKWDNLKSYIPYFVRNDQNVEKPINNRFEQFEYPENLKHLTQSQLNTKYYQDQLPKVNIRQKDGTVKTYSLVFVGEGPITDIVGVTRKGMRRHNYFRSYTLVDFETERVDVKITSTIRPTWKWNEKLSKKPRVLFYNNNRTINISKKDGSPMEGNRVLSFTRANDKQKDGTWGPDNWFISTTVQMERMGEGDHDLAFKNKRVFMNAPSNDSDRRGFLYNFETRQIDQVKYDGRNIFTTSDIVFDDNNENITIGDININIADRSYNNAIELKGKTKGLEERTLQDWFNMLWDKGQTMKADGTTTDMSSNRKKISDVKKEFKEIVKTQNDNVEMVVEQAENTVTEPTESIEETILKNTESFKAGGTQESLFGGLSLDSVKSSVEERLNTIIKISLRERQMNDRLDEVNDLIKEIESKNLIDQDDLESLNSEKIGIEDLLETLSTFQKIVDESEEFETVEQYINSELDRLKEGDTNTIMDMAYTYGILEGVPNISEPSTPTEAVMVSEGSVQSPNRYVTPQVPMLALPEPAGSRIVSNNGLMLTQKEIESIQYGLDKYTRNATMPLPLNGTVALNDERTIFLYHGQFGLYLERQSDPDMKPERVSYVFSSEAGLANFVKSLTSAENILDNLDEEIMPEPSDLLAEEYPSNKVIGANLLEDKAKLDQMVKDCEELGIVLGALDARALGQIILAYTKNGRGIDEVLEKFASDIPSSNVDEKLVDIMIKKGILSNAGTYGGLSLSQILAYNYGLKKIKKDQVKDIIGKTYITIGNGEKIYGLSDSKRKDLLNIITDYYIQNYLNLNPAVFGPYSKFREKFKAKVEAKLLSSEIYVHKDGTHSALDDKEDVTMFLNLLHIKPKLRKNFAEAAYTNQINAKPPREPLITLSQYNYLMESDPFITVIGNEEDYQVGPIGASVLDSINEIDEIGEITGGNANRLKLQLLFDIYTYYQGSRKASYEGLVKFLRNKYRYSELSEDNTMKKLIDVLEEDSKLSGTPIHSEGVMMTLRSSNRESHEGDPYQNFIKNERGDNSIIDALIILESNDENSFQQIIEYAPKKIKDELYERFQEENRENKSSNIAYRMVSGLLLNNYKVINDLKQESQKDLPKAEGAVRDMLLGFNPMSLVNSAATRVLYNKFGLRGLDLNKGTVILTNNRQNSLGKWMPNFKNVERFPLLPVSSLNDIKADVNVIVPYGVSIPKDSNGYNYNIIRMENAGYHDGALVVGKIGNRVVDFENRMYNIMGLYGLGVIQSDGFKISKEHKNIIRDNKTQKSLYWNIFKNNILPNLGENFQNITEDDFYNAITSKAMRALSINMLYKCFAAGDMQELIDNSIAVINAVTNNEFKLRSNNAAGRKTIDTYDAINQFSEFISKQSLSNKAKERIAKMFGDFLMIQMRIGDVNIADRRTDFKTTHSRALDELYKLPDVKNAQVKGVELWQIFVNGNLTKKEEPTKQQIEDSIIDAQIDKSMAKRDVLKRIDDQRAKADKAKKDWEATKGQNKTQEQRNIRSNLYNLWQKELSKLDELENELDDINNKNYFQNNYIEYVNGASGVKSTQNLEEAQNSMVLTDEAEDQNRIFSGKAMKVLEYLYNNYINNNAVTVEPGQSPNSENHVVSKDLLGMLIGENTFNNTYRDVTEGNKKVKRYAYSQSDLNQLVGILTSLKKTNAKRFKEVLDDIFRTYEDIGYTYDTPEHLDLIKYKSEVANNPANLYKIFGDLSNDKRFSIQFLEGGKVEKKLNYKDINMDGLLQSASKEYFEGSPYIVRTAEGVENMNKKVKEYHEKYDQYFEGLLPDGIKPSDEQIKGFAKLKSTFDHRKEKGKSSSKRKVFVIPGIAGAGKTTMLAAFFRYVNGVGGAQYEVDNIANGKQTSIIYQFSPDRHKAFNRAPKDKVFYAKIANKDKGGGDVYIKFTRGDMKTRDQVLNMPPRGYTNEDGEYVEGVLDGYSNIWGEDAIPALTENGEGYEKKWLDKRDNQLKSGSYSVWKISKFEIVTDPNKVPANPITIRGNDGTLSPDASRYQDFPAIESNRALSDIHFAVRMHQTISSLKSTFSNDQKFNGIDYGTEASYMTQANNINMRLFGYNDSPIIKKQMEGQFIIIDEAQNSYNSDLQAITEQLGGDNVVVMLGDFHQNSKGDFFKNLSKDEQYMVETHRGTEDINIMNEINAFTQNALIKANAVGFYMNDSDDFRRYDSVNPEWYNAKPNEYLMVCRKNKTRKDLNAKYLESLGATIKYDKEGKIEDVSDIQPIIDNNTKLQVMVVDVRSDKKMNKRGRKSEMPNSGLDMGGFKKSKLGNCYYKETDGSLQLFFPYTETSNYEGDIKDISKSDYIRGLAKGKDIEIFVPAFAITTEKESGKTVDNIILHDELVNIEYDSLSEQNVQTFYDAFTRGSKKVYIPQKAPRLIGITREDAKNLMEGKPLSKGYVESTSDKVSVDDFTMPVITVKQEGGLSVLDDIDYLLGLGNFTSNELSEAVGILRNYNMGNQTFGDYEYQGEHRSNDYVDVLKKRVADLWDQNRDRIKTTLENQGVAGENIEGTFNKINAIIYGRVYKVPIVRNEKGEYQYWDGSEGQNDYRIWGNSKWQNKIVTLDDFRQYGMQIEDGIGTEGQVYRPQILQDKGKLVMKMVPVNGRWVQRTTKGRIERRTKQEKEVIDIDAEKMEIERIFNFQFNNNVISEEGFRMQDYKPIAGDGININASLAKTPVELWTSNKKKGTIFEMNPNLSIDQKMNLVDTLKNKLKEKVETYYSLLEENELYKPVEVPYNPFMVRKIGTSLEKFGIDRIDPSIIDGSETFRTDSLDDAKVGAIINKIYEKYKGARNKDYLQYDPDGPLPEGVKREDLFLKRSDIQNLVYTQPEYGNATPEQIEKIKFDESHTPTALQVDYESIMRQIDNIKVASAVDNERLNGLKANIGSFMERVYDIVNRENFAGYDNEEFGEGGTFSLNDEGLYSSCEDAENCGG